MPSAFQREHLPDDLYHKIEELILEYQQKGEQMKTAIGVFLGKDHILFDDVCQDWEQCIRTSAAILIQKGCIGMGFVEKAIQNIKDYGDYIILGNGVALAHAGKDYGVHKDGLSLLVSHSGIEFTESGRKVNFLFCFSSRGVSDHIELFQEIVEIGQNDDYRNALLKLDKEALYEALCYKKTFS